MTGTPGAGAPADGDGLLGANRDFTWLWLGQAVSDLGSAACLIAYPLVVLEITRSAGAVGLFLAVWMVASLVVTLPAGAVADRFDKRKLMLVSALSQAAVQGGMGLVIASHRADLGILLALAVSGTPFGALFSAAHDPAVRHIVSPKHLSLAFARTHVRGNAAALCGPPLGGLLYAVSPALPFVANAASFLFAAVAIALIRTQMRPSIGARSQAVWTDVMVGLKWLWRMRFMRTSLLLIAGLNVASNALFVLIVLLARQHGDAAPSLGLVFSLGSSGGLVGALLAPRLVTRASIRSLLVVNRIVWAALIPMFLLVHDPYGIGALLAVMYFIGPAGNTALTTRQLTLTPARLQGRTTSATGFVTGLSGPIGTGMVGYVAGLGGTTLTVLGLGAWMLLLAAVAGMSRSMRREGSEPVAAYSPIAV